MIEDKGLELLVRGWYFKFVSECGKKREMVRRLSILVFCLVERRG